MGTVRQYIRCLSTALSDAVQDRIIVENPAKSVKLPESKKTEVTILSPKEVTDFLKFTSKKKHHDLVIVFFYSGARRGEIFGLRESDVNFETNQISFNQTVTMNNGMPYIQEELKTDSSKRTITLDSIAMQAIKRQIKLRVQDKLRAGSSYQDHGLVFARSDGAPLSPHAFYEWFCRAAKKFGRPDLTPHVVRHTHASLLIMGGEDILTVSKRLGHASVTMTLDVYGHLLPQKDKSASDRLAEILKNGVV